MASTETSEPVSDDKGVVADAVQSSSSTPQAEPAAPLPSTEPDFGDFKVWNPPKSDTGSTPGKCHVNLRRLFALIENVSRAQLHYPIHTLSQHLRS